MSFPRRKPADITYKLLKCVDEKGEATRWDLTKIVGSTYQFKHYVTEYLIKENVLEERKEGRYFFYKMTSKGMELYSLLQKDYLIKTFLRISGRRLRSESMA